MKQFTFTFNTPNGLEEDSLPIEASSYANAKLFLQKEQPEFEPLDLVAVWVDGNRHGILPIEKVTCGTMFKKVPDGKVLVRDRYNIALGRYDYHAFEDINDIGGVQKGREVFIGFTY